MGTEEYRSARSIAASYPRFFQDSLGPVSSSYGSFVREFVLSEILLRVFVSTMAHLLSSRFLISC